MPAVQLNKLTTEIETLLRMWEQPAQLLARLVNLLEYHADHLYQASEQTRSATTLPIYRIPPIVQRNLERAFSRSAAERPGTGLALADALWQHGYQETHRLAAAILGSLPSNDHPQVFQRLSSWLDEDVDVSLIHLATRQIRLESLPEWLKIISSWLDDKNEQHFGLLALSSLMLDPTFENLPFVFQAIIPLIQNPPASLIPEMVQLLEGLARRSPAETTYLFRQMITTSVSMESLRLLRRALPSLPDSAQISLGPALRDPGP